MSTSFFEVSATGFARAAPRRTWHVLTDYDRLPEFVPELESSKLLSRNGLEAIVEQQSKADFLFLSRTIRLVVRVIEQPFSVIDIALVSGDMKHYTAQWELEPSTHGGMEGTRITYSGTIEPDFLLPPLLTKSILHMNVKKMLDAVVTEIDRRCTEK